MCFNIVSDSKLIMEAEMNSAEKNRVAIKENRKRIFSIDAEVMTNKALIYSSRSIIEENRSMILSNYAAAFMGNRQLANNNTDEIFKNRHAILDNINTQNDTESNFVNAQKNKASLDFLEHRSKLNTEVLEISNDISEINSKLIEINEKIMASNKRIVDFNSEQIGVNSELLNDSLHPENATPDTNAELIKQNRDKMADLEARVSSNREKMEELVSKSEKNSKSLIENKKKIHERRVTIMKNRENLLKNRSKIMIKSNIRTS